MLVSPAMLKHLLDGVCSLIVCTRCDTDLDEDPVDFYRDRRQQRRVHGSQQQLLRNVD